MAIQSKKIIQELKSLFAGIDVGAEELILTIRKNGTPYKAQKFANTHADRARLVKKMVSMPGIIVCLEATGVYHFDLSIALHDAGVALMVVNPKSSHNFAKVLMKNSKTDAVDAETLAQYAERMDFVAWTRPSDEKIALRSFARRIDALTRQKAAAKNNCHALSVSKETPEAVLRDVKLAISQLEKRIERLAKDALDLIGKHPELERVFLLLTGIKGIAQTSTDGVRYRITNPVQAIHTPQDHKTKNILNSSAIFSIRDLSVRSNSIKSSGLKSRPGSCPFAPVA